VIVYVVDVVGFTGVDPCGETFPTPGSIVRSVAFVDDHESDTGCPALTSSGEALIVTVGCGVGAGVGAGGVAATCFLHPAANPRSTMTPDMITALRKLRTFIK
jgi:hypothetical protein